MPSFLVHIAVAKEYMRKHKNDVDNEEEFIKGTVEPDFTDNKYETHYHNYGNPKVAEAFLKECMKYHSRRGE